MIHCVIIDDEPLAREGITNYVREIDFLRLITTCENPLELMKVMEQHTIDLIFLDIQTPKMSGLDFLKTLQKPPMVIITTAFPSYALEGFQLNVLDYLVKPITFDRFFKASNKAREYQQLLLNKDKPAQQETGADYFFIKCSNKYEKIFFEEILYIEAMQNYVTIVTTRGKYITLLSLKSLEENLEGKPFIRVHKSYIVPLGRIDSIDGNELRIGQHKITMSRNYREQVMEQVLKNKLWVK